MPWQGVYHPEVAEGTGVADYMEGRFVDGRPRLACCSIAPTG